MRIAVLVSVLFGAFGCASPTGIAWQRCYDPATFTEIRCTPNLQCAVWGTVEASGAPPACWGGQ